jgi:hypothetical protein
VNGHTVEACIAWLWHAATLESDIDIPHIGHAGVWFLTDWQIFVNVTQLACQCEGRRLLHGEQMPDDLHRGVVIVPGILHLAKKGRTRTRYEPFENNSDLKKMLDLGDWDDPARHDTSAP